MQARRRRQPALEAVLAAQALAQPYNLLDRLVVRLQRDTQITPLVYANVLRFERGGGAPDAKPRAESREPRANI